MVFLTLGCMTLWPALIGLLPFGVLIGAIDLSDVKRGKAGGGVDARHLQRGSRAYFLTRNYYSQIIFGSVLILAPFMFVFSLYLFDLLYLHPLDGGGLG